MFKKTRGYGMKLSVLLLCVMAGMASGSEPPDLVPMPKEYLPTGAEFRLEGQTLWIDPSVRQCQIAAEETALRIKELGGKPGEIKNILKPSEPGIYILPLECPTAAALVKELALDITPCKPGPQGYIIKTLPDRLVIIGSDAVGALYGAMTLRQMMYRQDDQVSISGAYVYDKPDYRYRTCMSFLRGLSLWVNGETNQLAAYKAGIDWMIRFKLNGIDDYQFSGVDIRRLTPEGTSLIREVNAYAVERGIYPSRFETTCVADTHLNPEIKVEQWPCVKDTRSRDEMFFFCWSRDDLAEARIKQIADFYRDCHFKMLLLHPVDGGGINDPELWSRRCPECKKRFGDDRWKATVHQVNLWARIFRERAPGVRLVSPFYPYSADFATYESFKNEVDKDTWKKNTVDYWSNVNREADRSFMPQTWTALRPLMDKYRACWANRPISIFGNSAHPVGFFSTMSRNIKTDYYGNPDDHYMLTSSEMYGRFMSILCCNEFCWNTLAPGHEAYAGIIYDIENDHTGPKEIIEDWVPRACRAFYGNEVGRRIAPLYQAGIQEQYIMNPGEALARANKSRRRPLADVDPLREKGKELGTDIAADVADSPGRMEFQVNATKKAMDAMAEAYPHIGTLDKYRRKTFMYYYKRVPLWHMIANVWHTSYMAAELQKKGEYAKASEILTRGLQQFEADNALAADILKKTANDSDTFYFPPLHDTRGDVKPKPDELKQMLLTRLEDSKLILKPRHPGPALKVAVYQGAGQQGIMEYLATFSNVKAELINRLNLSILDRYDCVIILQTDSIDRFDYFENLRRYVVESGGGAVFQHDLCGFGRNPFGKTTPFPEVVRLGKDRRDGRELIVAENHPALGGLKKGESGKLMYVDYIILEPGNAARVIARDARNEAVVAVGQVGHGKVVFYGGISIASVGGTYSSEEKILEGFDAYLVRGSIEWTTGVKLEKK